MSKLDFKTYTDQELYQAFEEVDEVKHPTQAREILRHLLEKTGIDTEEMLEQYSTNMWQNIMSSLMLLTTGLESRTHLMQAKIQGIVEAAASEEQ